MQAQLSAVKQLDSSFGPSAYVVRSSPELKMEKKNSREERWGEQINPYGVKRSVRNHNGKRLCILYCVVYLV